MISGLLGSVTDRIKGPHPVGSEASLPYTLEISETPHDPSWDAFVNRVPEGSHVQTSLWGSVKANEGWDPVRMVARLGDEIAGGAQAFVRHLPLRSAVAYIPKGPISHPRDEAVDRLLLDGLPQLIGRYRIRHLSVQPPNDGERWVPLLQAAGYRTSDTAVAPVATVQIDLRHDLDRILAEMRKNHRRYVRHGLRSGIVGRVGSEQDLEPFYRLVQATGRRQGFTPPPFDHFVHLWETFHPPGLLQLLVAEYQGQLVSGQLVVAFGERVIAKNSGWTGEHGSLGPNYVMEWTSIRWAKENGYRYYDLEGIDLQAADRVLRGESLSESMRRSHSFYKLGFGGEVVRFPATYVLVPNPLLRWGYWSLYPRLAHTRLLKRAVNRLRTRSGSGR